MPKPYRHPKTGIYWLRLRVPEDVRAAAGRAEVRRTLRTRDPEEARARLPVALSELQREWSALRTGPVDLTLRQVVALAGEAYRATVAVGGQAEDADIWRHVLERASDEWLAGDVDALCLRHGIVPTAITRSAIVRETAKAVRQAFGVNVRAGSGDFTPDPLADRFPNLDKPAAPSPAAAPAAPVVTLTALYDAWQVEHAASGGSPKSASIWHRAVSAFIKYLGHDNAAIVTPKDVSGFAAAERARGLSAKTVNSSLLAALRSIYGRAVATHVLTANPAEKVRVKADRAHRTRSKGFTDDEAKAILTAASDAPNAAGRWLPFLLAYTGARIGELSQLRRSDVLRDASTGIDFIRISPDAGTVKTGLHRDVPLHPELVALGFPEWAAKQRAGRLFPVSSDVICAALVAEALGPAHGLQPNHAWRHRFKSLARENMIPRDAADAIQGHADSSASGGYGDWSLRALAHWVERIPRVTSADGV